MKQKGRGQCVKGIAKGQGQSRVDQFTHSWTDFSQLGKQVKREFLGKVLQIEIR